MVIHGDSAINCANPFQCRTDCLCTCSVRILYGYITTVPMRLGLCTFLQKRVERGSPLYEKQEFGFTEGRTTVDAIIQVVVSFIKRRHTSAEITKQFIPCAELHRADIEGLSLLYERLEGWIRRKLRREKCGIHPRENGRLTALKKVVVILIKKIRPISISESII